MKYYFKFFNEAKEEKHIIYDLNKKNPISVNLNSFDVKVFMSDIKINHDRVTNYKIIVEREINGVFIKEQSFSGERENELIKFNDCECKYAKSSNNIRYKIYLEAYEGGIVIYTDKDSCAVVTVKHNCDNFYISVYNSILIKDFFELQDEELNFINFKVELEEPALYNSLMYYYTFNNADKVFPKEFQYLKESNKDFKYAVTNKIFDKGETKLHFFMKDSFGNIKYKIIKMITKHNKNEIFEIIDYNKNIKSFEDTICFFYNSKNITNVKPFLNIKYIDNKEKTLESKKIFGLTRNTIKSLEFKLSDCFDDLEEHLKNFSSLSIFFKINETSNKTENLDIRYDKKKPDVVFLNLNKNYLKLQDDIKFYELEGQLTEDNLFYIGLNTKKYDFKNISNNVLVFSDKDIYYLKDDSQHQENKMQKFENCYYSKIFSKNYALFDLNKQKVSPKIVLDDIADSGQKCFFIYMNTELFNTYERNLIANNKLIVKSNSDNFVKYECLNIGKYIVIKCFIKSNCNDELKIDIQIEGFEYSFLKYINSSNISAELNSQKFVNCDFEQTKILPINTNKTIKLKKFNSIKEVSQKNNLLLDNISVFFLSLKSEESFTTNEVVYFLNHELNEKENSNIYSKPVITKNKESQSYDVIIDKIDESNYKFKVKLPIDNGINEFTFKFKDIFENESDNTIKIEKQLDDIYIALDEEFSNDAIFLNKKDRTFITTNKRNLMLKILVFNETLSEKDKETFLIIRSKGVNNKCKIIRNKEASYAFIELNNLDKIQDYNIYYENINNVPLLKFSAQKIEALFLDILDKNIITGNEFYYLKIKTNDFTIASANYNQTLFSCDVINEEDGNKSIMIKRNSNVKNIEKCELIITAYDSKNIFKSVSKNVSIVFYNDTFVNDYWITQNQIVNNKLITPSFDLHIKLSKCDFIKDIYYYDDFEVDFVKRKKQTKYDKEKSIFTIKDIVSPLQKKELKVYFELHHENNNIVILKKLFKNNPIQLLEEEEKITIAYNITEKHIFATLKNHYAKSSHFDSLKIFANDKQIFEIKEIDFDKNAECKYEITNSLTNGRQIFKAQLNKGNKIFLLNEYVINYERKIIDAYITNINEQNIGIKDTKYILKLHEDFKSNNKYTMVTYNPFGNKEIYDLKIGDNDFYFKDIGMYKMELYSNNIILHSYVYQIFNSEENIIKLENPSVLKYNFIKEIHIHNFVSYDVSVINPRILYFYDNDKEKYKEILPYYIKENLFKFVIPKKPGNNKYKYVDNFTSKDIGEFKMSYDYESLVSLGHFHTNDKTIFTINGKEIQLNAKADLYFTTNGIRTIIVNPLYMAKTFTKIVLDNQENVIQSAFMPCEIKCYDEKNNELNEFNYSIKIGGIDEYKY